MNYRNEIACPVCSEIILQTARKCKHCGEWLQSPSPTISVSTNPQSVDTVSPTGTLVFEYLNTIGGRKHPVSCEVDGKSFMLDLQDRVKVTSDAGPKTCRFSAPGCSNIDVQFSLHSQSIVTVLVGIRNGEIHARTQETNPDSLQPRRQSPQRKSGRRQEDTATETSSEVMTVINGSLLVLLVGFFLPWFQLLGVGYSGFQIAKLGSYAQLLWLSPVLSGVGLVLTMRKIDNKVVAILSGGSFLALCVFAYQKWSDLSTGSFKWAAPVMQYFDDAAVHMVGIGLWLTAAASITVVSAAATALADE